MPKKIVTIYTVQDDNSMKVFCRAELADGAKSVSFAGEGIDRFREEMASQGIRGKMGKPYFPSDGEKFLENLKYEFSGSRMRASGMEIKP
jgi:hypothetical protein